MILEKPLHLLIFDREKLLIMQTIQQLKDSFISDTEAVIMDLAKFKHLSKHQINWKPSVEVWCVAECIDHLIVTNKLYLAEFEKQFAQKQITTDCTNTKSQHKLLSKFIIKSVNPANVKKVKTFPVFMPSKSEHSLTVFEEFKSIQANFINIVRTNKDLDLNRYVMSSPAAKIIKENFCDVLEIIRLHDRRHFNQAERIINHPEFPEN
jgi:hypothetical protein